MGRTQEEKALDTKLKGVMDFYTATYFEHYSAKLKEEVAKHNVFIESDMMDRQIDDYVQAIVEESAAKFHDVCMLILDTIVMGREDTVRAFETLFMDLVERTLVKIRKDVKRATPIVIVTESPSSTNNESLH